MITKSSRQGDDGLGSAVWPDVRGEMTGDCDDPSLTPAVVPLATAGDFVD